MLIKTKKSITTKYNRKDLMSMMSMSCEEICERAVWRWKQEWHYEKDGLIHKFKMNSSQRDDVVVCIMDIVSHKKEEMDAAMILTKFKKQKR